MTTAGPVFLDTNIVVYAFSTDRRSARAEQLLAGGGIISVQVLNEFANVARRKLGFSWPELRDALQAIELLAGEIVAIDLDVHRSAIGFAERFGFSTYDALIVSAAHHAECSTLWSEDMQHGLAVTDRLTIRNPFHAADENP